MTGASGRRHTDERGDEPPFDPTGWIWGYALYAAMVAVYYCTTVWVVGDLPTTWIALLTWVLLVSLLLLGAWLAIQFYTSALRTRTGRDLKEEFRARVLSREARHRLLTLPILLAGVALVFDAFPVWKTRIPTFQPYVWDPMLADIDAALHGGDPWRWTHRLLGPTGTAAIDWFYIWGWWAGKGWMVAVILTFDTLRRRLRYLLANILTWIIGGSLLATVLASGGPIFFERLGFGARFEVLGARIEAWAPTATGISDRLWEIYETGGPASLGGGISAMPSLHVAAAVLLALWGWNVHRWAGIVLVVNALLILLGSVHLGWHYAIDGYVGAALAAGFWLLSGRIVAEGREAG